MMKMNLYKIKYEARCKIEAHKIPKMHNHHLCRHPYFSQIAIGKTNTNEVRTCNSIAGILKGALKTEEGFPKKYRKLSVIANPNATTTPIKYGFFHSVPNGSNTTRIATNFPVSSMKGAKNSVGNSRSTKKEATKIIKPNAKEESITSPFFRSKCLLAT